MTSALSGSPPTLPIPRQPSPLSFSSVSNNEPPSPIGSTSSQQLFVSTEISSPASSRLAVTLPDSSAGSSSPVTEKGVRPDTFPVDPLPDSLLLRSTFNALEHSAGTLKRLSKSVLGATATYLALLEQVERAEEDVFESLGELGKWLEGGYAIQGSSIWDQDGGIRKIRKSARQREREEMEVMVEHGLKAVKADLKRNGLVGGSARARFENTSKQYYQQTSAYLSPNPSSSTAAGPSSLSNSTSSSTHSTYPAVTPTSLSSDLAQSSRLAQFDLARYSHHSTLLYAVPPTSIACLDLLVGFYSWVGGLLGESLSPWSHLEDGSATPKTDERRRLTSGVSAAASIRSTLSTSLASLAGVRAGLLESWSRRNQQTLTLERYANERQSSWEGNPPETPTTPSTVEMSSTPISSAGIEHKKPRKMHKLHRSVGGKLRELLSSSGSTTSLAQMSSQPAERVTRASLDGGYLRNNVMRITPLQTDTPNPTDTTPLTHSTSSLPKSPPLRSPSLGSPRPRILSRHSMHATRPDYISPFIASQALASPSESSPNLRLPTLPAPHDPLRVGGVGGLGAGGDEDEQREEAGRKKEGVLWGAGQWESLSKGSAKGKWEKFWVVLDRSRIYEYRDNGSGKPESASEVIDLKFASVREGRGTDRRFVFEIVTPTQGRRSFQATSEYEMKQWLYAICNAIESCINGTSSVRTFDMSKLRTVSGSLDDYALPTRQLLDRSSPRAVGLGLPMPTLSTIPTGRQSLPPLPRSPLVTDPPILADSKRQRKPSLKKVLRQSAEMANEKWNNVVNNRYSTGGLDLPRPTFLTQAGRASSSTSTAGAGVSMSATAASPPNRTVSDDSPWMEDGIDEVEKRVLEMAGLGLGMSPGSPAGRRIRSEGVDKGNLTADSPNAMMRTKSADTPTSNSRLTQAQPNDQQVDMQMLRAIADKPENRHCADCGKGMKSSRWATLSLRDMPMVMFLCIRCVGIHRGLGTHISKPRSVDLDIWNRESILLAQEWGNERGNAVWERKKPKEVRPKDEDVADFIRAKYVQGRWLDELHRAACGL